MHYKLALNLAVNLPLSWLVYTLPAPGGSERRGRTGDCGAILAARRRTWSRR